MGPNTYASRACSAKLNGEMFVFGGIRDTYGKQVMCSNLQYQLYMSQISDFVIFHIKISKIIDCGLKRIGELPHEFEFGACGTFEFSSGDERVMFCFPWTRENKCFR